MLETLLGTIVGGAIVGVIVAGMYGVRARWWKSEAERLSAAFNELGAANAAMSAELERNDAIVDAAEKLEAAQSAHPRREADVIAAERALGDAVRKAKP